MQALDIIITVLMGILLAAQIALAVRQIKKGAPDGRILLTINIVVAVIWIPLTVCRFVLELKALKTAWFIVDFIYMIFTIWYTNNLSKTLNNQSK
ncbi:MAG: hypothetical protein ACI4EU_04605 [Butyrivibrio sp.]